MKSGTAATINEELERNRTHIETYYEASIVNIILGEPYDGKVLSFKLSEEKIVQHLSVLEGIIQKIKIRNRQSEKSNIKLDDADIFEQIKKLKELYDLNIISKEEFEEKKTSY